MDCAQCKVESKALPGGASGLCGICSTADLNVLAFGCAAQSTPQAAWCFEKVVENCPTEPCYSVNSPTFTLHL